MATAGESQVDRRVVVCDTGTGFIKCGFAGDNAPRAAFPCMTGRPVMRNRQGVTHEQLKDLMVGEECLARPESLQLRRPVSQGVVQDWDDMEAVWDHAFRHHLGVDTSQCKVMLTDPPLNPTSNRERMLTTMFEVFGFEAAFVQVQAVLTLYAQGLLTGLVVDSGDGVTHAVPVVEGFAYPHLTKRLNLAGSHVTRRLLELLTRSGYPLNPATDLEKVRLVKEKLCYVANDYSKEMQLSKETTSVSRKFTLPDGQAIKVEAERFMACEPLFRPELMDIEAPGIADMVFSCIQEMDIDNRMGMYRHIVLSGGSTMFPGLSSRLEKELRELYLQQIVKGDREALKRLRLKVEDPPRRRHMVFLGAAVLADIMKDNIGLWVTKAEYDEDPRRALMKCGSQA